MVKQYKAVDIKWDVDDPSEEGYLPTEVVIPSYLTDDLDMDDPYLEGISDYLTDRYGFFHNGFRLVPNHEDV